jgi:ligand-binding sensor domain-containing protein/two-component sensor histidine kinase
MNHLVQIYLTGWIMLYFPAPAVSSDSVAAIRRSDFSALCGLDLKFENLSIDQGLSQSIVTGILQDRQGYLWFSTEDGLNKFDGYQFHVLRHDPTDSNTLAYNDILTMYEDRSGHIWLGTFNGGLNCLDPVSLRFQRFQHNPQNPNSLSNDIVRSLCQDAQGCIWVGADEGLNRYDPRTQQWRRFVLTSATLSATNQPMIRALLADTSGYVWIGTERHGLFLFDPISQKTVPVDLPVEQDVAALPFSVRCLYTSRDGHLWLGSAGYGLYEMVFNHERQRFSFFQSYRFNARNPHGLSSDSVMVIFEDRNGYLWIGSDGGGLNVLERGTGRCCHFHHRDSQPGSISYNQIYALFQDRSGVMWIGTYGGGISKLNTNKAQFMHYRLDPEQPQGLNHNIVWSIFEDWNKMLWIGTHNGLNRFDRKREQWTSFRNDPNDPHSLSHNIVRMVYIDRQGRHWVGTHGGGLNLLDPLTGRFTHFRHHPQDPNSLSHDELRCIYQDAEGFLWIGTNGGGLDRFDPDQGRFVHFCHDPGDSTSLSCNYVRTVFQDRSKHLWIGTQGGGLELYNPHSGGFTHFRTRPGDATSLNNDYVFAIAEDMAGRLWLGTWGGGLNVMDRASGRFQSYTVKQGLCSNSVYGILEDHRGDLWLSTNNGLSRFNPATISFANFAMEDGLQSREFNGGAYFQSKEGELFFGGINGFNAFFPQNIYRNSVPPPVVITDFLKFNQSVKSRADTNVIELDWRDSHFSFEFAALDYRATLKNRYAYKMENLNEQWIYTDAERRFATFTALPAGQYVFRVKGSNSDGVWNETGAAVRLIVHPPFWKTWWFDLALFALIGGILYFLISVRVRSMLAVERIRLKIAADLHDNIGAELTEISILTELIQKRLTDINGKSKEQLQRVSDKARNVIDSMNDTIWLINPKRDSLYELILRLQDAFADVMTERGISLAIHNLQALEQIHLPMEYRQHLYLIFKEALNNCLKHSRCQSVQLHISVSKKEFEIRLADDGIGVSASPASSGNGLNSMRRRAGQIGGALQIIANQPRGACIVFQGPY